MTAAAQAGIPIVGDTPALDLANTIYAIRGRNQEGLGSPDDLIGWAEQVAPRLGVTPFGTSPAPLTADEDDLERFRRLRDAIRSIGTRVAAGGMPQASDVDVLNADASRASRHPLLAVEEDGTLRAESVMRVPGIDAVLAALAEDAIDLFGSERSHQLRDCQAPGCPLFFLKDHPRREWCTPACGNRVRAARAYKKRTTAAAS